MNARDATISEYLVDIASRIRKSAWPRSQPADELPLRSELFSADRLEQYAQSLIASLRVSEDTGPTYDLAARAGRNGRVTAEDVERAARMAEAAGYSGARPGVLQGT